jgi:hypothetical protein
MSAGETIRRLSEMSDDAAFERLAMAVLRDAKPEYAALIHTGVNAEGKTVKAPIDGIAFVTGAKPPRMIAVHHTTCKLAALKRKWLHDPSTVTPRTAGKPTAPLGDLLKTAQIFAAEQKRTPSLQATLILATNRDPPEDLIRDTIAEGRTRGIDVDIWSGTALAHYLDTTAQGQWLRREHLGINQERLSRELLAQLSRESLNAHCPYDHLNVWVSHNLDRSIADATENEVLFIIAESGLGKSVACFKYLSGHIDAGGYGLILPHDIVASALTVDHAVAVALSTPVAQLDTRSLAHYLGHRNLQSTARYTALAPDRFTKFWQD